MKKIERLTNTFLVQKNISIIEALKCLDDAADKVVFVVDQQRRLLGALTDGDVRRHLLNGRSLENSIARVYNKTPQFLLEEEYSSTKAKAIFLASKVFLLPIVNGSRVVVDVVSYSILFAADSRQAAEPAERLDMPVVIMAGGKGTRLDPFTKILPKPLIPIGDKPIIELIMDNFQKYGMEHFYVTLNHRSKMIKAYFEEFKTEYKIAYINEEEPLGTAGGLRYLPAGIAGPLFVSNSDILIEEDYRKILAFHKSNANALTIVASVKNDHIPYGVCEIENGGILRRIREKPNLSYLVNTGMYVLDAGVLASIPGGARYDMTELINDIKAKGSRIGVFPVSERSWVDIGDWAKYKAALENLKA